MTYSAPASEILFVGMEVHARAVASIRQHASQIRPCGKPLASCKTTVWRRDPDRSAVHDHRVRVQATHHAIGDRPVSGEAVHADLDAAVTLAFDRLRGALDRLIPAPAEPVISAHVADVNPDRAELLLLADGGGTLSLTGRGDAIAADLPHVGDRVWWHAGPERRGVLRFQSHGDLRALEAERMDDVRGV